MAVAHMTISALKHVPKNTKANLKKKSSLCKQILTESAKKVFFFFNKKEGKDEGFFGWVRSVIRMFGPQV
jgi:predicted translin family RNA/ssDNA-binding protein